MKMGVITNYALMLLWMHQYGQGKGFTKKQIAGVALGHIDDKFITWPWSPAGMCSTFAALNANKLLTYDPVTKLWYQGEKLEEYLKYHFGPYTHVYFEGESHYDAAVLYNQFANQQNEEARKEYHMIQEIGKEYFFQ